MKDANKTDKIRNKEPQISSGETRSETLDAHLTVRFLATSTGTVTTELLGLGSAGVGDQERTVVSNKELTELKSRGGVVVLGVVGDERLGDSLTDSVDLRGVTTTGDTETDVDGAVS